MYDTSPPKVLFDTYEKLVLKIIFLYLKYVSYVYNIWNEGQTIT